MTDNHETEHQRRERELSRRVGRKEARKLKARGKYASIWFGLGTFGIIGWSVAIPTMLGILVGVWIDNTWPSQFSFTLMLMLLGLGLGCWNAWHWIARESRADDDDDAPEEPDNDNSV